MAAVREETWEADTCLFCPANSAKTLTFLYYYCYYFPWSKPVLWCWPLSDTGWLLLVPGNSADFPNPDPDVRRPALAVQHLYLVQWRCPAAAAERVQAHSMKSNQSNGGKGPPDARPLLQVHPLPLSCSISPAEVHFQSKLSCPQLQEFTSSIASRCKHLQFEWARGKLQRCVQKLVTTVCERDGQSCQNDSLLSVASTRPARCWSTLPFQHRADL